MRLFWLLVSVQALPYCCALDVPSESGSSSLTSTVDSSLETPATSSLPVRNASAPDESLVRQQQANASYEKAIELLHTIRSRSVASTLSKSTSLFSADSYTPLLTLIESTGTQPLSGIIKACRRISQKIFGRGTRTGQQTGRSWSVLQTILGLRGLLDSSDQEQEYNERAWSSLTGGATVSRREIQAAFREVERLLTKAGLMGKAEAWSILADLTFWGRYGSVQNMSTASTAYKKLSDQTGDPLAQYMLGFLHSSNLASGAETDGDQAQALLYYTFAGLGGSAEAEMTVGYRHWVGIGADQNCKQALPFYKSAADKAMRRFTSGPAGGLHLPPPKQRLSDADGGVFGPGASVASTGVNAYKNSAQHSLHNPKTGGDWEDYLEFYTFHADRGSPDYMFRLGRIYYQGFGSVGAVQRRDFAPVGTPEFGGRDFPRALKWFTRIARSVWPRDPQAAIRKPLSGQALVSSYDGAKDPKSGKDEHLQMVAALAAGYLGKMHLRGEGVAQDFTKAFLWFSRGAAQGDQVSNNGLGMMYRDGLGVAVDHLKALHYFQAAATENLPEAQVNLGRFHVGAGDLQVASQYFELAIRNGDMFESYYYLAEIHAHAAGRPDLCPVAVAFYKIVAERGDWDHEVWWEAERAWNRGDKQRALLGYWLMAERGYEAAQNNVAYILDQDKSMLELPTLIAAIKDRSNQLAPKATTERLALTYWTRSAAQDNYDALVKMGDYYLKGLGLPAGRPQPVKAASCYQTAASTHLSALAMYNLGWMHEHGVGVMQDFHLAKRYYDLALETNSEAYLPVVLALVKLHARNVYYALTGGQAKSLTVRSPFSAKRTDNEAADASLTKTPIEHLSAALGFFVRLHFHQGVAELLHIYRIHKKNREHTTQQDDGTRTVADAKKDLSKNEDPIKWAKEAREREGRRVDDERDPYLEELDYDASDTEFLESIAIVAVCMAIGWLFYYRQARQEAARAARNGQLLADRPIHRNP